jgi:hypothetical protein
MSEPTADDTADDTAQRRIRRARIAAHASWARTLDPAARTAPGTRAFLDRFDRQVDPDGTLPSEVRANLARHARRAYMLSLAERSAKVRRQRRTRTKPPAQIV